MKLFTTAILLVSLSVATLAKDNANFNTNKEKKIAKITKRLTIIEQRKSCMQNASSLEGMQTCRVEKNKNKPFKLKKGMTFQQKQAKVVARITTRISKVSTHKTCVQNALNMNELKACKPQKKVKVER